MSGTNSDTKQTMERVMALDDKMERTDRRIEKAHGVDRPSSCIVGASHLPGTLPRTLEPPIIIHRLYHPTYYIVRRRH